MHVSVSLSNTSQARVSDLIHSGNHAVIKLRWCPGHRSWHYYRIIFAAVVTWQLFDSKAAFHNCAHLPTLFLAIISIIYLGYLVLCEAVIEEELQQRSHIFIHIELLCLHSNSQFKVQHSNSWTAGMMKATCPSGTSMNDCRWTNSTESTLISSTPDNNLFTQHEMPLSHSQM